MATPDTARPSTIAEAIQKVAARLPDGANLNVAVIGQAAYVEDGEIKTEPFVQSLTIDSRYTLRGILRDILDDLED